MPNDYRYDVFLSYSRRSPVGEWVRNHFHPLLDNWLSSVMQHEPRIFVDWNQEVGANWPANIQRALIDSRMLVSVWSPQYFRSDWCVAEWHSMRAREELLGLGQVGNPLGLVYPVIFSDGATFPNEAKLTQHRDLSKWNFPRLQFNQAASFLEFEREMQQLAEDISSMLERTPPYRDDWPTRTPAPYPPAASAFPGLS
jgi:hypothetical protein